MAEFCQEDDLSFLNDFPEDLFLPNEGKVNFLDDDIFDSRFPMRRFTPQLDLQMPVQVEDSNLTHGTLRMDLPLPQFIAKSLDDRAAIATTSEASRKRKQAADEMTDSSDSDDVESICSTVDSREKSLKFAQQFLAYGIHCKHSFWQYNQESRGPKAKRLLPELNEGDFHILSSCIDPASDSIQNTVSSNGHNKGKHGSGNDLRPDPLKLLQIGSRISELEETFKSKEAKDGGKQRKASGRERNILASRICRLRKKSQHEANKIKLEGLQKEQSQLIDVSLGMLNVMHDRIVNSSIQPHTSYSTTSLRALLTELISRHLGSMVAGHTVKYVNRELETAAKKLLSDSITGVG